MARLVISALVWVVLLGFQAVVRWPQMKEGDPDYKVKYLQFASQRQQVSMAYRYEKAPKPNGRTVLLLHGKNFSGAYWQRTMKVLLDEGYDVVAPDQVGFGQSSKPTNYQFTFQQLSTNTKQLLHGLGIQKAIVLGHSMGGMLALRFALMHPDMTEQLILENPLGLEDWKLKVPYLPPAQEFVLEMAKSKATVKNYMLENYFHGEWKDEYNTLLQQSTATMGTAEHEKHAWCQALATDMIYSQPVLYEFSQLRVPTTLIIGQADRTAIGKDRVHKSVAATLGDYPKLGKTAAQQIPRAELIELEDVGHIPHAEVFDLFIEKVLWVLKQKEG